MSGQKFDSGKLRWSLLPLRSIRSILEVLEFGAKKYAPDNWQRVEDAETRYFDAAMRHLTAWFEGERLDPVTGKSHLAHAACCLLFLIWFDEEKRDAD